MKLETNSKHKKGFLTIPEKVSRIIATGGTIIIVLLSGCDKDIDVDYVNSAPKSEYTYVEQNYEQKSDVIKIEDKEFIIGNAKNAVGEAVTTDTVVKIPDKFKSAIAMEIGKDFSSDITVADLGKLEKIAFSITSPDDLSWINYCVNLREININFLSKDVDFSQIQSLPNLEKFSLLTSNVVEAEFSESQFGFLHGCPNLHELQLHNLGVEPGFVESLTQVKELVLNASREISMCIDFSKLTHLDKIVFPDDSNYEIPIYFTENDYNTLVNAGVTFSSTRGTLDMNQVLEIGRQLDQMVASLGLTDQSTDQEKLDAILVYVLENYSYDQEVSALSSSGEDYGPLSDTFYVGGDLYGVFNKGGNIICGNYSALVEALARRVGLDAHSIVSKTHAWNIVNIEGENYVVDATWLDGQSAYTLSEPDENGTMHYIDTSASETIKSGNGESLHWYMEKPSDVQAIDENNSHVPIIMPPHINLESKEDGAKLDVTPIESPSPEKEANETKKFSIKVGTKEYIIGGSALVGILSGLGLAMHIKKKNKKQTKSKYSSSFDSPSLGETPSYGSSHSSFKDDWSFPGTPSYGGSHFSFGDDSFGATPSYGGNWSPLGEDSSKKSPFRKKTSKESISWPYSEDDSFDNSSSFGHRR